MNALVPNVPDMVLSSERLEAIKAAGIAVLEEHYKSKSVPEERRRDLLAPKRQETATVFPLVEALSLSRRDALNCIYNTRQNPADLNLNPFDQKLAEISGTGITLEDLFSQGPGYVEEMVRPIRMIWGDSRLDDVHASAMIFTAFMRERGMRFEPRMLLQRVGDEGNDILVLDFFARSWGHELSDFSIDNQVDMFAPDLWDFSDSSLTQAMVDYLSQRADFFKDVRKNTGRDGARQAIDLLKTFKPAAQGAESKIRDVEKLLEGTAKGMSQAHINATLYAYTLKRMKELTGFAPSPQLAEQVPARA